MIRSTVGFCLLLVLGYTFGIPVEEPNVDLGTWKAPAEIQLNFPYYLSGYDTNNRPIWIFEVGKYPFNTYIKKGPETVQILATYFDQIGYRVMESLKVKNPNNTATGVIGDFDKFDTQQLSNQQNLELLLRLVTRMQTGVEGAQPGTIVLVNVNSLLESLLKLSKDKLGVNGFNQAVIFGQKKEEWIPKLLQLFPADQLPPWYGGDKSFQAVKVYGR